MHRVSIYSHTHFLVINIFYYNLWTDIDILLLTWVCISFRFFYFYIMPFSVPGHQPECHIFTQHISLGFSSLWQFFRLFLFWWWWHFEYWSDVLRISLNLGLSHVFLIIKLGVFLKKEKKGIVPFSSHHIKDTYVSSIWLIINANLYLAKVLLFRFLHKVNQSPLCILYSLEGSYYMQLTVKELGIEYLYKFFEILLHEKFIFSPPLIYSTFFNINICTLGYLFYTLVIIQYNFISLLKSCMLFTLGVLPVGSCVPLTLSQYYYYYYY